MNLPSLVVEYGYTAVFIGSLLEGETVLLLAGAAAQQGYLSVYAVVALAFCGGMLGDQLLFAIGRRHGIALLRRYPKLAKRAEPAREAIRRYQNVLVVGVRFMYGLRLVGPFAIGMSDVSSRRFLCLNMLGAALWAPAVVGVGYAFGHTVDWLLADLARFELAGLGAVLAVVAGVALWRWRQRRRRASQARSASRLGPD